MAELFDHTLAVLRLDFKGFGYNDTPNLAPLRERHPELAFVWDKLQDLLDDELVLDEKILDTEDEWAAKVEKLTDIMADARDRLTQMDASSKHYHSELKDIAADLDKGVHEYA